MRNCLARTTLIRTILIILVSLAGIVSSLAQTKPSETGILLENHGPGDLKQLIFSLNEFEGIQVVRHAENAIYFTFASEETRLTAMQSLLNRSFQITQLNGLPIDFPLLPNGANDAAQSDYSENKSAWIEANPQRYEQAQQHNGTIVISQEEFDQLPPNKQQYILDHPDTYIVEP